MSDQNPNVKLLKYHEENPVTWSVVVDVNHLPGVFIKEVGSLSAAPNTDGQYEQVVYVQSEENTQEVTIDLGNLDIDPTTGKINVILTEPNEDSPESIKGSKVVQTAGATDSTRPGK